MGSEVSCCSTQQQVLDKELITTKDQQKLDQIIRQQHHQRETLYDKDSNQPQQSLQTPKCSPQILKLKELAPKFYFSAEERGPFCSLIDNPQAKYKYYGDLSINGEPHGNGQIFYEDGRYLQGIFVRGVCCGQARIYFPEGAYYQGRIEGTRAVQGTFHNIKNEYNYEGSWKNNQPHGKGVETVKNKYIYRGQFNEGKKEGHGKIQYQNQDIYQGNFLCDSYHGKGRLERHNGDVFEGLWHKGQMKEGIYTWSNGMTYSGNYQNNRKHGKGKISFKGKYFQGQFYQGKKNGQGVLWQQGGQKHRGVWEGDIFKGMK